MKTLMLMSLIAAACIPALAQSDIQITHNYWDNTVAVQAHRPGQPDVSPMSGEFVYVSTTNPDTDAFVVTVLYMMPGRTGVLTATQSVQRYRPAGSPNAATLLFFQLSMPYQIVKIEVTPLKISGATAFGA